MDLSGEIEGIPQKEIEPLSNSELEAMLAECPETWSGDRDRYIMLHMFYTGSRVGEVVELDWPDVDLTKNIIDISPAKWTGERRLTISQGWSDTLADWRERCFDLDSEYVFPDSKGNQLTTRYVRAFVAKYAMRAGLSDKRVHPHLFRHTFASRLLVKTGNLRTVQNALGHNDLRTTMVYLHTIDAKQREQINSRGHVDLSQFEKDLPDVKREATK